MTASYKSQEHSRTIAGLATKLYKAGFVSMETLQFIARLAMVKEFEERLEQKIARKANSRWSIN